MQALEPATPRITDRSQGLSKAPKANEQAIQLTTEEAKEAPDVIVGTCLVYPILALVLFDSGACHCFVSYKFSKRFDNIIEDLDHP